MEVQHQRSTIQYSTTQYSQCHTDKYSRALYTEQPSSVQCS